MLDLVSFPGDGNHFTFVYVQNHHPFLSSFSNLIEILLGDFVRAVVLVFDGHMGDWVIGK